MGASGSIALCTEHIHVGSWKRLGDIRSRCSLAGCGRGGLRCAGRGGLSYKSEQLVKINRGVPLCRGTSRSFDWEQTATLSGAPSGEGGLRAAYFDVSLRLLPVRKMSLLQKPPPLLGMCCI